jgi:hypothetical protein
MREARVTNYEMTGDRRRFTPASLSASLAVELIQDVVELSTAAVGEKGREKACQEGKELQRYFGRSEQRDEWKVAGQSYKQSGRFFRANARARVSPLQWEKR